MHLKKIRKTAKQETTTMGLTDPEEIGGTGAAAAQLKGKEHRVTAKAFPNGEHMFPLYGRLM